MADPLVRPLSRADDRSALGCRESVLNTFFAQFAWQNQDRHRLSSTYVLETEAGLVGFLTVSAAHLEAETSPGGKRFPNYTLPVLVLARMGTSERVKGQHLGTYLVLRAFELAVRMSREIGCVGISLHAKGSSYSYWKEKWNFGPSETVEEAADPLAPVPMFLPIRTVEKWLEQMRPNEPG